eukprot:TRINITY_DN159_c1_g1_i1.p1 TRINITY_DN159_c1_g1~~TRINITY_DN159_c1_g1_i1.p1  ORF type:complete len:822 (+),score=164.34 TRINITY_DN159_c1_g1_i1:134-2599(+)
MANVSDELIAEITALLKKDKPENPIEYVSSLMKKKTALTSSSSDYAGVMCDEAARGKVDAIREALDSGVDPNLSDYDHRSALHLAAEEGKLDVAELLVSRGANVNCVDRWGNTPLSGAMQNNHTALITFLKSKGADAPASSKAPTAIAHLMCSAAVAGDLTEMNKLVTEGASVNIHDYDFRYPLHIAAEEGHLDMVKFLVEKGADVNCQDKWTTTPLSGAEACHQNEVVEYLRGQGARLTHECVPRRKNSIRTAGKTAAIDALIKAAAVGDAVELQKLIPTVNSVNTGDYDNRCALHLASEEGHMSCVKLLIEAGADLNVKDRWGTTPLRGAIRNTHNNIADYLKDMGATSDKFVEVPSYPAMQRHTRNFFEKLSGAIAFPRTEILPITALILRLHESYGYELEGFPALKDELNLLAQPLKNVEKQLLPSVKAALEGYNPPTIPGCEDFKDKFFKWSDFSDLVLGGFPEHEPHGDIEVDSPLSIIPSVVLDRLEIKNWEAFTSNLCKMYYDVLENTPNDGANADYIPELRDASSDRFAVSICTVNGQRFNLGHTDDHFSIQSVGKTFAYTRALSLHGHEFVHSHVGQEPSGRAFNDFTLTKKGNPFNPVTNAGAIVTCSMIDAEHSSDVERRLQPYKDFLGDLAGGMTVGDCMDVFQSEQGCAFRNYALANFMKAENTFPQFVDSHQNLAQSVEFYLRVCSCKVSTPLLANAAATYANYGCSPLTGKNIVTESEVKQTLQILSSCGMYDFSGEWACTIGMPAKSGVAGEIFVVVPGILGMCVWSPKLDDIGNSVRGIRLCQRFAQKFRFSVLDILFRNKDQ